MILRSRTTQNYIGLEKGQVVYVSSEKDAARIKEGPKGKLLISGKYLCCATPKPQAGLSALTLQKDYSDAVRFEPESNTRAALATKGGGAVVEITGLPSVMAQFPRGEHTTRFEVQRPTAPKQVSFGKPPSLTPLQAKLLQDPGYQARERGRIKRFVDKDNTGTQCLAGPLVSGAMAVHSSAGKPMLPEIALWARAAKLLLSQGAVHIDGKQPSSLALCTELARQGIPVRVYVPEQQAWNKAATLFSQIKVVLIRASEVPQLGRGEVTVCPSTSREEMLLHTEPFAPEVKVKASWLHI